MTYSTLAFLQNIGGAEMIIILIIALLIFGGRLPETARNLGKSINEFKRGVKEGQEESLKATAQDAGKTEAKAEIKTT